MLAGRMSFKVLRGNSGHMQYAICHIAYCIDAKDHEVDLVLEDRAGDIVGIEIKATASPSTGDFKGLARLRELAGARLKRGILLHTGAPAVPFGDRLFALPMQCLWRTA
jgi:hypothetical protein